VTILKSLHCHPCNTRTYPEVAPRQFLNWRGACLFICALQVGSPVLDVALKVLTDSSIELNQLLIFLRSL
jgi:hypothetical protein